MQIDDFVKSQIALTAWRAAGHISTPAALSVMFVLRTRTGENGDWLKTIEDADLLYEQVHNYSRPMYPDPRDPRLKEILDLVDSVYDGTRQDRFTGGGIYWYAPDSCPWGEVNGREITGSVGGFVLFK